jgi:uncharacterized protein
MKCQKSLFFYAKPGPLSSPGEVGVGWLTCPFFFFFVLTCWSTSRYDGALMLDCLPEKIEPLGLSDAGRSFRGEVPVSKLLRLLPSLSSADGVLKVQMTFCLDERRIHTLRGTIEGSLSLVCQRCLKPLHFPLELSFRLGIVTSEADIDRLPQGYEPLLVSGEPLKTIDVVEDEILLAIPAFPLHEGEQGCVMDYENQRLPEKDNPFSVLEKLKS